MLEISPLWKSSEPLRHTWEGIANIDQFRWMVRKDTLEHLALAAAELGTKHVRAVGMFDDEMRFWSQGPSDWAAPVRRKQFNFQTIDFVMDSLLDLGISPMFTTCFTPSDWARGEKTVFSTRSRVGMPLDLKVWATAVQTAVRHAIDRYGIAVVRGWYFEVWNEINLTGFFDGTQTDFFELWKATHGAIKTVDANLRVGGPSTARAEWIGELLDWSTAQDCRPDYLITHIYNNDSESGALSPFDGPQEERASRSPHFASGVIRGVRRLADRLGFQGEVHWNEWGRTWHSTDPQRETPNEAAWLVKTMSEVSQEADVFAYWCLSDIYDQLGYTASAFEGHYGMMNLHGLRKPSWHAHQLLGALGSKRIPCDAISQDGCVGAIITRDESSLQALVFAYLPGEDHQVSSQTLHLRVPVEFVGRKVHLTRIDSQTNNILVQWRELGSPQYPSRGQIKELRGANRLQSEAGGIVEPCRDGGRICCNFESPGLLLICCSI